MLIITYKGSGHKEKTWPILLNSNFTLRIPAHFLERLRQGLDFLSILYKCVSVIENCQCLRSLGLRSISFSPVHYWFAKVLRFGYLQIQLGHMDCYIAQRPFVAMKATLTRLNLSGNSQAAQPDLAGDSRHFGRAPGTLPNLKWEKSLDLSATQEARISKECLMGLGWIW